jgi:predicted ATPase/DNA-binding SARP family transcriptional activator
MEIAVLGPVEVIDGARRIRVAAKQQRLLAALAVDAGGVQTADALIDAVWGSRPPDSAAKLLTVYVSQLRKALPIRDAIRTNGSGYALDVSVASTDAERFERFVADGRDALAGGNARLAASLLRRGLGLWRGGAYGDLAYEDFARSEAERLEELRLVAMEHQFDARLSMGEHDAVLPELSALAAGHPLHERLQCQAMLALYRCGRQADALDYYRTVRGRLREVGLEPSEPLRTLQRRMLEHDEALDVSDALDLPVVDLPASPNALVGRGQEVEGLRALLVEEGGVRLLTLAGAGGSGKTRLAIEVARSAAATFANGAIFVPLATVRDASLVPAVIADAAGVQPGRGTDVVQALAAVLRSQEVLLVVDNFEHVLSAASCLVELLARTDRLKLLVTSRVVLHATGEHVYPVQPLSLDDAAELFRQRALAADPAFERTADSEAIVGICARVDGLPLAVELASGHARMLTPPELLTRLDRRLPLLAGGARDLPARQRTLRATLEWSYELLDRSERRLFGDFSVFTGPVLLETIETVCETTATTLSSLVDHNLVVRTVTATGSRYFMLETIREFAAEHLEATGDTSVLLDRHAQHFLELAERMEQDLRRTTSMSASLGRLEADYPNERCAIEHLRAADRPIELARLVGSLNSFWANRGFSTEACNLVEAALAAELPPRVRLNVLRSGYKVAPRHVDHERSDEWACEALELGRGIGDARAVSDALTQLGWNALDRDELETAERWLGEAVATALAGADDNVNAAYPLMHLGRVATHKGDYQRAQALLVDAIDAVDRDDIYGRAAIAGCIAQNAAAAGDDEGGAAFEALSIEMFAEEGTRAHLPWAMCLLAGSLTRLGDPETAARLIGAAEAEERSLYGRAIASAGYTVATLNPHERAVYTAAVSETRAELGDETFEQLRAEGRQLTMDEALRIVATCTSQYQTDQLRSRLCPTP